MHMHVKIQDGNIWKQFTTIDLISGMLLATGGSAIGVCHNIP